MRTVIGTSLKAPIPTSCPLAEPPVNAVGGLDGIF